jgi:hypothetical protein
VSVRARARVCVNVLFLCLSRCLSPSLLSSCHSCFPLALAAAPSQFGSHRTAPKRTPGSVKPYATLHLFVSFVL